MWLERAVRSSDENTHTHTIERHDRCRTVFSLRRRMVMCVPHSRLEFPIASEAQKIYLVSCPVLKNR